jgi:putative spermidine/putrescine transport system substrate-binding protein
MKLAKGMCKYLIVLLLPLLLLTGCSSKNTETQQGNVLNESWNQILAAARGTTVNFYMWGGSESTNNWVDTYVASAMEKQYGIKVNRVPMLAPTFVNQLLSEKQANRQTGEEDLLWINGENFRTARQADLLWGPFAGKLPNFTKYVDATAPDVANDFGFPTNGYEVPWGKAEFVFAADGSKTPDPPKSAAELLQWVKEHPGRFTYPDPTIDFTGSVFIRQVMYELCGGYQAFPTVSKVDDAALSKQLTPLWNYLNEMKPYLWRQGQTYPSSITSLEQMFADGEVDFYMTYTPTEVSGLIANGLLPDTVRTYVWNQGDIGNTHFVAIAFNAPNKAGALVLANFLLSPEAQLSKYDPNNWGDFPSLDMNKLDPQYLAQMNSMNLGQATLPATELLSHRLPEINSEYVTEIQNLWKENVLDK